MQRELLSGVGDGPGVMVQSLLVVVSVIFLIDVLVMVLVDVLVDVLVVVLVLTV